MAGGRERIWELARGFQASRVLLSAIELGVFSALGEKSRTSAEVAVRIGADDRATDRLLNALVVLGLLDKSEGFFANTIESAELLVPGKPGFIGGGLLHSANLWKTWSTLTDAVRAGTSVYIRPPDQREASTKSFIAAMQVNAVAQAQETVSRIDLTGVRRILDIGGGSGAYSIEFCRTNPEIEAVVFDTPDVVPLTREYVSNAGMSERISTVTGDFNIDDLPTGFDMAFMSQILHSNSPDECAVLIKKVHRSLNPGGKIVVQEFVVDEDRTSPPGPVFFALNMLVATPEGDAYTESEIRRWFEEASFTGTQRIDATNTTILTARKA